MFESLNKQFQSAKKSRSDNDLIVESVLDVDEVIPGTDDEMEAEVDVDSVPDDVYKRIDAELDKIVSDPNYDDTEAEELFDEDDEISDEEIDAVITETCAAWLDDEGIGHPDVNRRSQTKDQPLFNGNCQG